MQLTDEDLRRIEAELPPVAGERYDEAGMAAVNSVSLDHVRAAAERHVGDENVPGLVALVAHGDEVHVEALGKPVRRRAARASATRCSGSRRRPSRSPQPPRWQWSKRG